MRKIQVNTLAMLFMLLVVFAARSEAYELGEWYILPELSPTSSSNPTDSGTGWEEEAYISAVGSFASCLAWDTVTIVNASCDIDTGTHYLKRYVVGRPCPDDKARYVITGTVEAKVAGNCGNGIPASVGETNSYGYAKIIGNAPGYNDNVMAELNGNASEDGGWSIGGSVGKDGAGVSISQSGGGQTYNLTKTDDLDKEAVVDAENAFAKCSGHSKADAEIINGANGLTEGWGDDSYSVSLTKE